PPAPVDPAWTSPRHYPPTASSVSQCPPRPPDPPPCPTRRSSDLPPVPAALFAPLVLIVPLPARLIAPPDSSTTNPPLAPAVVGVIAIAHVPNSSPVVSASTASPRAPVLTPFISGCCASPPGWARS